MLPLAGAFQASNALVAAGLAIAAGIDEDAAFAALAALRGAPGRLELVGRKANGALVFVDYAHKPEALASMLQALRPLATGRLVVVFGAGGDRDPGKRPLMGKAAVDNADVVIVTDDNPAERGSGGDPRRDPRGGARRHRDRRPARGDRAAPWPCSGRATCSASPARATRPARSSATTVLPFSDHQAALAALAAEEAA